MPPGAAFTGRGQVHGKSGILCVPLLCEQCRPAWATPPKTLLTEQWHTAAPVATIRVHTRSQAGQDRSRGFCYDPAMSTRLLVMFFASGALGLVYETVFGKLLSYVFGVTAWATCTVLASFMAGLALGSVALGGLADRTRRPLLGYAVLELLIGAYCLAVPTLSAGIDSAYALAYDRFEMNLGTLTALRFALSFVMIVIPTFLMGGTLPMMARFVVRREDQIGPGIGWLYALNTLGAAVGTLVSTFVLMPNLPIDHIIQFAAAANGLLFVWALVEQHRAGPVPIAEGQETPVPLSAPAEAKPLLGPRILLLGALLSGAVTLGYQVVWTHVLAQLIGMSVYAFGTMLFSFLVGLSLGAMYVARRKDSAVAASRFLYRSQLLAAGFVAIVMPLWGLAPQVFRGMGHLMEESGSGLLPRAFWLMELTRLLTAFGLLIGPTFFLGCAFPLLIRLYGARVRALGGSIGRLYFVNAIGAIVGSVGVGFWLLPMLKSQPTIRMLGTLNVLMAGMFWWALMRREKGLRPVGLIVTVALLWLTPSWDLLRMNQGSNVLFTDNWAAASGELIFHEEDLHGIIAVTQTYGKDERCLWTNGKFEGNNTWEKVAQQHFAHYPCLYSRQLRRALTIGLGTGCTLGAMTAYPFERIDVCELSENVVAAARQCFTDINFNCLDDDPRVQLHVMDGRSFLRLHKRKYDVISVQVSSIWFAGAANLYSREFYALCRDRLEPKGVLQQWVQLHHQTAKDLAVTLRTARQAFKYALLFTSGQGVLLLSNEPLVADYEHLATLSARPAVRNVLSGFEGKTLFALLGSQVLDQEGIDRFLTDMEATGGSAALVSRDLYPYLEYATPRNNAMTEKDKQVFRQHLAPYIVTGPTPIMNVPDQASAAFARAAYYYGRALTKFFSDRADAHAAEFIAVARGLDSSDRAEILEAMRNHLGD